MPATVTLSTTTLAQGIGSGDGRIRLASTSGVTPKLRLFVDRELMEVVALEVDPWVTVRRGVDGTSAQAHNGDAVIYIGRADQFYDGDPVGAPPLTYPVAPYINVKTGQVWHAQGDSDGNAVRWWQAQTTTYSTGPMGVRVATLNPTSST